MCCATDAANAFCWVQEFERQELAHREAQQELTAKIILVRIRSNMESEDGSKPDSHVLPVLLIDRASLRLITLPEIAWPTRSALWHPRAERTKFAG